jgi:hypothetical protein
VAVTSSRLELVTASTAIVASPWQGYAYPEPETIHWHSNVQWRWINRFTRNTHFSRCDRLAMPAG